METAEPNEGADVTEEGKPFGEVPGSLGWKKQEAEHGVGGL